MISLDQMAEARRALGSPLFADVGGDLDVSFEFFPPKSERMEEGLWAAVETLAPLAPEFISVTYGAGGSTRERTQATVARIARETAVPAAAHPFAHSLPSVVEIGRLCRYDMWPKKVRGGYQAEQGEHVEKIKSVGKY